MLKTLLGSVLVVAAWHSAAAEPLAIRCLVLPSAESANANSAPVSLVIDQETESATLNPALYRRDWKVTSLTNQHIVLAGEAPSPKDGAGPGVERETQARVVIDIDRYTGGFRMTAASRPSVVTYKGECLPAVRRF